MGFLSLSFIFWGFPSQYFPPLMPHIILNSWLSSPTEGTVLVMYCIIILSKTYWLKTTHTCYLTISVGQGSEHSLVGSFASKSHKAAIKVSIRAVVSPEAWLGKNQLPSSTWLFEEFSSLQAARLRASFSFWWLYPHIPSLWPCPYGMELTSSKPTRESLLTRWVTILCNIITYTSYPILLNFIG